MSKSINKKAQKFNKSDEYWQYRVATNIKECIDNLPKFMEKRQLYHVKLSKIKKFKWMYGLFGHNYLVAALSTTYPTVLGIINRVQNRYYW